MEPTESIWMNGKWVAWDDAKVHFLTHTLHYGGGTFEGIRVYKTDRGPAIFRLQEHLDRLLYSANALKMALPYTKKQLTDAIVELISKNNLEQGYIRPLVYYGYGVMGLNPRNAPVEVGLACWPWGLYLPHEMVDLKVSSYIRIHPKSTVADAKLVGHYVNSMLAVLELKGTHYHEALLLDCDGNIAEGPGENFFIVKNGEIFTPTLGTILPGITRNTVLEIATKKGIKCTEKKLTLEDAFGADEAFYTGTAAEVTLIKTIDDKTIGSGTPGKISKPLKDAYLDVVYGRNREYDRYLTYVI